MVSKRRGGRRRAWGSCWSDDVVVDDMVVREWVDCDDEEEEEVEGARRQ